MLAFSCLVLSFPDIDDVDATSGEREYQNYWNNSLNYADHYAFFTPYAPNDDTFTITGNQYDTMGWYTGSTWDMGKTLVIKSGYFAMLKPDGTGLRDLDIWVTVGDGQEVKIPSPIISDSGDASKPLASLTWYDAENGLVMDFTFYHLLTMYNSDTSYKSYNYSEIGAPMGQMMGMKVVLDSGAGASFTSVSIRIQMAGVVYTPAYPEYGMGESSVNQEYTANLNITSSPVEL